MEWIIQNEQNSLRFFQEILKNESTDFYKIPAIQMMIEFLHVEYKRLNFLYGFPLFILQIISFCTLVWLNQDFHHAFVNTLEEIEICSSDIEKQNKKKKWKSLNLAFKEFDKKHVHEIGIPKSEIKCTSNLELFKE